MQAIMRTFFFEGENWKVMGQQGSTSGKTHSGKIEFLGFSFLFAIIM